MWARRMRTNFGAPERALVGEAPVPPHKDVSHTERDESSEFYDDTVVAPTSSALVPYHSKQLRLEYVTGVPSVDIMRNAFSMFPDEPMKKQVYELKTDEDVSAFMKNPKCMTALIEALKSIVPPDASPTEAGAIVRLETNGLRDGKPMPIEQAIKAARIESLFFNMTGLQFHVEAIPAYVREHRLNVEASIRNSKLKSIEPAVQDEVVTQEFRMFEDPLSPQTTFVPVDELVSIAQNLVNFRKLFENYTENDDFNNELQQLNSTSDMTKFLQNHHDLITQTMDAKITSIEDAAVDEPMKELVRRTIVNAVHTRKFVSIEQAIEDTKKFFSADRRKVDTKGVEKLLHNLQQYMGDKNRKMKELMTEIEILRSHKASHTSNEARVVEADARSAQIHDEMSKLLAEMETLQFSQGLNVDILMHMCEVLATTLDELAKYGLEELESNYARVEALKQVLRDMTPIAPQSGTFP